MNYLIKTLLLVFLLTSCKSASTLTATDLIKDTKKPISEIMIEDAEYGASILHDKQQTEVAFEGQIYTYFTTERYILYINDKGEKYTNQKFSFSSDRFVLLDLDVVTIKSDGSEIVQTKENIKESTITNNRGDEIVQIEFNFPNVEPGDIMYFRYKRSTLQRSVYNTTWDIDFKIPVRFSQYILELPRSWSSANARYRYNMFTQNIVLPKPLIEPSVAKQSNFFTYELSNIMPTADKLYSLPEDVTRKQIEFYYVSESDNDWNTSFFTSKTGNSAINYSRAFASNSAIESFVDKNISRENKSEFDIINDLKKAIHDNFELNDEGVFHNGYVKPVDADITIGEIGSKVNLKNLNVLYISMLRYLGYDAFLTFNKPYSNGEFFKPKVELFDLSSCLTFVKGKNSSYWVDLRRKYINAGEINYDNQLTEGFLINDKTRKIEAVRVGLTNYKQNKIQKEFVGEMDDDFNISGEIKLKLYHNYTHYLRYQKSELSEEEFNKYLKTRISDMIDYEEVSDINLSDFDPSTNSIELTAKVKLKNMTKKLGNNVILPSMIFKGSEFLKALKDEKRVEDFYFLYASTEVDRIKLKLPKAFKAEGEKLKQTNNNKYIKYDYSAILNQNDNTINLFMLTQFKKEIIPGSYIKTLVNVKDALNEIESHNVRLVK